MRPRAVCRPHGQAAESSDLNSDEGRGGASLAWGLVGDYRHGDRSAAVRLRIRTAAGESLGSARVAGAAREC